MASDEVALKIAEAAWLERIAAGNLGRHTEAMRNAVLTAVLAALTAAGWGDVRAAEQRGRDGAIADLRDAEKLTAWFDARLRAALDAVVDNDGNPIGERPWPPGQYPPSAEYAEYLEAQTAPSKPAEVERG